MNNEQLDWHVVQRLIYYIRFWQSTTLYEESTRKAIIVVLKRRLMRALDDHRGL